MFNFIFNHTTRQSSATATSHRSTSAIYSLATSNCTFDILQQHQRSPGLCNMTISDFSLYNNTTGDGMGAKLELQEVTRDARTIHLLSTIDINGSTPLLLGWNDILCYIVESYILRYMPGMVILCYTVGTQTSTTVDSRPLYSVKHACQELQCT